MRSINTCLVSLCLAALALPVAAQDRVPESSPSIFAHSGQGGRWIGEFFPYQTPDIDSIHAALGRMLEVYNSGILALAGIIALWSLAIFVAETAHHGTVGGKRSGSVYGLLRVIVAVGLLVPMAGGYNGAQLIAIKLAESGSGLANSVWQKFVPAGSSYDFSHTAFAQTNLDSFLQQAFIDEACLAAVKLNSLPGSPVGSVSVQAFYPDPAHPGRDFGGEEIALSSNTSDGGADDMAVQNALQADSLMKQATAHSLRVHYDRVANDDYCGSLELPVPVVPAGKILANEDQSAYLGAFLRVRPNLANYVQKIAAGIDAAVKARGGIKAPAPQRADDVTPDPDAQDPPQADSTGDNTASPQPAPKPGLQAAPVQVEVPELDLPPQSWTALLDKFDHQLRTATDRLEQTYINAELKRDYGESSDADWISAGSLFFKLTRLSHDDLKLRFARVSGDVPSANILPPEMRSDGAIAICPDLRADVFLPDYHCRPEGKEATLVIKTAYSILHKVEAQRGIDVLPALDAGPGSGRKNDPLSGNLLGLARLDTVVEGLAHSTAPKESATEHGQAAADAADNRFDSMFEAVNVGNALFLSSSALFREASLAGQSEGQGVHSMVMATLAGLILIPAFFLGIFLPLFPALRFFMGMATWLVTIFEALVALPLVVLVQLRGEGEGLLVYSRQGWIMLLQMLLRPALMIFGLMAAVVIFEALYEVLTWAIWSGLLGITDNARQFGDGIEGLLEILGYLFFWTLLVYLAANISFNAITAIPDRILLWIGSAGGVSLVSEGASSTAIAGGSTGIIGGNATVPGLPPVSPASLITGGVTGYAGPGGSQANQIGGPASTISSGAPGASVAENRANASHFPRVIESHSHDSTETGSNQVVISSTPKMDSTGKPITSGRENKDFIPPVQGDQKS